MIKAIAIDDEENALGIITEFSSNLAEIQLVKTFLDPNKALDYLSGNEDIQLVFLDIQMNKLNGLKLAENLNKKIKVVLTTAYPDFALQGFDLDVTDYLLKPFSFDRFHRSVKKVMQVISETEEQENPMVNASPSLDDYIFVRCDHKTKKIQISEITYIEGSGNYVTIHTFQSKYLVLQNLKKFEEQLLPYRFVRVHKSYIISIAHLDSIEKSSVKVANEEIPLSDSYKESIQKFIDANFKQF